jgi:hypothetical protein
MVVPKLRYCIVCFLKHTFVIQSCNMAFFYENCWSCGEFAWKTNHDEPCGQCNDKTKWTSDAPDFHSFGNLEEDDSHLGLSFGASPQVTSEEVGFWSSSSTESEVSFPSPTQSSNVVDFATPNSAAVWPAVDEDSFADEKMGIPVFKGVRPQDASKQHALAYFRRHMSYVEPVINPVLLKAIEGEVDEMYKTVTGKKNVHRAFWSSFVEPCLSTYGKRISSKLFRFALPGGTNCLKAGVAKEFFALLIYIFQFCSAEERDNLLHLVLQVSEIGEADPYLQQFRA